MADYCKQCALKMFGDDTRDLAGLSTADHTKRNLFVPVICEGCGFIYVDHEGNCQGGEACEQHHEPPEKPE